MYKIFRTVFCIVCLLFFPTTNVFANDWSAFMHDTQRTGATLDPQLSLRNIQTYGLSLLWKHATGGPVPASPTVFGNIVYIGSWDGYMYALDATTGSLTGIVNLGKTAGSTVQHNASLCNGVLGVTSSAAIGNGKVFVGGGDANWYKMNLGSLSGLTPFFSKNSGKPPYNDYYSWSSPLFYNNFVYITLASNCDNPLVHTQVLKIDPNSNAVVAKFDIGSTTDIGASIWSSPSVNPGNNTIYITTGNADSGGALNYQNSIIALDANTLAVKNKYQIQNPGTDSDFGASPTVINGQYVAAANKNGILYIWNTNLQLVKQIQIATGGQHPEQGQGSISSCAFAANMNTLFCAGGGGTSHGTVRAINMNTLNVTWMHSTAAPVLAGLAYTNGLVVDVSGNTLEILDANTGNPVYTYTTQGGALWSAPSISNGKIYFGSYDGNIYALGFTTIVPIVSPPLSPTSTPTPTPTSSPTPTPLPPCQKLGDSCVPNQVRFECNSSRRTPDCSAIGSQMICCHVTIQNGVDMNNE